MEDFKSILDSFYETSVTGCRNHVPSGTIDSVTDWVKKSSNWEVLFKTKMGELAKQNPERNEELIKLWNEVYQPRFVNEFSTR